MLKMLHMAGGRSQLSEQSPICEELKKFGTLEILEQCRDLEKTEIISKMKETDILVTMWGALAVPPEIADDPGNLKYILHLTGTVSPYIPIEIIKSDIPVTNWGDAPANAIAEGAMVLLLAVMKDLRARTESVSEGKWFGSKRIGIPSGTLDSLKLGLYGCGAIGKRFVELVKPFKPELYVYDPYITELPEGCQKVDSLEKLFDISDAVSIFAGLSDQTGASVDAQLLAKLPDDGIIINVARGEIIDQEALLAELKTGRLRAGLDVLSGNDSLAEDHEARNWRNLILTCHDINSSNWPKRPPHLSDGDKNAIENLRRFAAGEPLKFEMDEARYNLST